MASRSKLYGAGPADRVAGKCRGSACRRAATGSCRRIFARPDTRLVARPCGAQPVCAAWLGYDCQRWPGSGDRRPIALCHRARLHGLSRLGSVRQLVRAEAAHRCHHQNRRRACTHPADRGRAQLPLAGPHGPQQARRGRCRPRCGTRGCLEGADPAVPALPPDDGQRQAKAGHRHRDRT
jgi:hypothetical protein